MAVIHISEEEAARELSTLIDKVRAGEQVHIDCGAESFAIVPASPIKRWTISEAIRMAEERGPGVAADQGFADDLEEIMRFNRLERPDPWESSWMRALASRPNGLDSTT